MNYIANTPHPYGVKAPGNQLFATQKQLGVRHYGFGLMNQLTDEAIMEIILLSSSEDVRSLLLSSKAFYVFCHHTDIWRDLTLIQWDKNHLLSKNIDCSNDISLHHYNKLIKRNYISTWKDTFVAAYCIYKNNINILSSSYFPHKPIIVDGIYSNLLYKPWACHTCNLSKSCPGIMKNNDIKHINSNELSIEEFVSLYESKNIPIVLKDSVNDWKALNIWNEEYLIKLCGNKKFRATSATAPIAGTFTMEEYFNYAKQCKEEAPLYLFERNFTEIKELETDYIVPKYFNPKDAQHGTDLFHVLGEKKRPDYRWLIAGPARSGSIFHIDPNQTNAWNCSIKGRKKWIFYPPNTCPPGVLSSIDGADVTVPLSTGEWLLTFWSQHLEARKNPDISQRPLETICEPGELIFVPHGYWHMVINLDDTIALTQNYVSSSNLSNCLRFLRDKSDQISGVRDRSTEAIQPEEMFNKFTEILNNSNNIISNNNFQNILSESYKISSLDNNNNNKSIRSIIRMKKNKRKLSNINNEIINSNNEEKEKKNQFSFDFF